METRRLGSTGAIVGVVGLGTATWGRGTTREEARTQVEMLLDAAGNAIDIDPEATDPSFIRDCLSGGALRQRSFVVLRQRARPSRGDLLTALDAALDDLGTGHADLWVVDGWHDDLPWEELVSALAVAQSSGRAMYVGLAPREPWQAAVVAAALACHPDRSGLAGICVPYSLLDAHAARRYSEVSGALDLGILATWTLAGGVLTGKYRHATPPDSRGAAERHADRLHPYREPWARPVVEGLSAAAEGLGVPTGALAIAWVRQQPHVATTFVGARTVHQWRAALASTDVVIPSEIGRALDEVAAHATMGSDNGLEPS